jgi:hypothetical protein
LIRGDEFSGRRALDVMRAMRDQRTHTDPRLLRTDDHGLVRHGITVLEIEAGQIVGIDAFIDPTLSARFASGA